VLHPSDIVNLKPALRERLRGALLGAAIGDALGSAFEFVSSAAIERAIGGPVAREFREALPGSLLAPRPPGIPTDDTAMTLALIAALLEPPPLTPTALFKRLVAELRHGTGRYADIFWNGGPGGACTAMMRIAESGAGPFEGLNPNAGGNGAAMRAHPCGAFPDRAVVADLAAMQAKLSHPHPGAVAAAQVVALIVHDGLYTGRLTTELPAEITDPDMTQAWQHAHRDLRRGERLPRHLLDVDMAGWNTVAAAHAIAQLYVDDPETGIGIAAGSGRDTDTVASITGAMLGAVHGAGALPERWITGLQHRAEIEAAAEALYQRIMSA
jgi:ADP-ribosyl-[dinitrogen reductase] hydrolase